MALAGRCLGDRWELVRLVGSGACSEVYEAHDRRSAGDYVVKVNVLPSGRSKKDKEAMRLADLLYFEHVIYGTCLNVHPRYFATSAGYGEAAGLRFLALRRLGKSLEPTADVAKVAAVGRDVLAALRIVHAAGYAYVDVKPENIMLGVSEGGRQKRTDEARLVDFGVATKFRSAMTGCHRVAGTQAAGTARFASVAALRDESPASRRDDCEALGHVLLWAAGGGSLPWDRANSDEALRSAKLDLIDSDRMVQACRLPASAIEPLRDYLYICREMPFKEIPDYGALDACLDRLGKARPPRRMKRTASEISGTAAASEEVAVRSKRRAEKRADEPVRPPAEPRRASSSKKKGSAKAAAAATTKEPAPTSYEACLAKARQAAIRRRSRRGSP